MSVFIVARVAAYLMPGRKTQCIFGRNTSTLLLRPAPLFEETCHCEQCREDAEKVLQVSLSGKRSHVRPELFFPATLVYTLQSMGS
jgi:hypothetical protein